MTDSNNKTQYKAENDQSTENLSDESPPVNHIMFLTTPYRCLFISTLHSCKIPGGCLGRSYKQTCSKCVLLT